MIIPQKHPLISGTLLLASAGLFSRILGFFFRILLNNRFGAEGVGLYQLTTPVITLSFSLCIAGYQTAISRNVAANSHRLPKDSFSTVVCGSLVSFPLALLFGGIVYVWSDDLAVIFLKEPRTENLLRILALSLPFSALHSSLSGYFYGMKKPVYPAITQLTEQVIRITFLLLLPTICSAFHLSFSLHYALYGLLLSEIASCAITGIALCRSGFSFSVIRNALQYFSFFTKPILSMALPLSANRLVISFLQSLETISIPIGLRQYGYSKANALSLYGIVTGMALPLVFFPNTLTGSLAQLLLPTVSESIALGKKQEAKRTIQKAIGFSLMLGFGSFVTFFLFGPLFGHYLFRNASVGEMIKSLSFLCPFLYLNTTLSGVLQGLELTNQFFLSNVLSSLIRLLIVFFAIPRIGIRGMLAGILISQLLLCFLNLFFLNHSFQKNEKR